MKKEPYRVIHKYGCQRVRKGSSMNLASEWISASLIPYTSLKNKPAPGFVIDPELNILEL
jgi:hypothetical protein